MAINLRNMTKSQQYIEITPKEFTLEIGKPRAKSLVECVMKNKTAHQIKVTITHTFNNREEDDVSHLNPEDHFEPSYGPTSHNYSNFSVVLPPFCIFDCKFTVRPHYSPKIKKHLIEIQVQDDESTKFTETLTINWVMPKEPEKPKKRASSSSYDARDCPICWDRFNDTDKFPRTLTCGHTHCHYCLEQLWSQKPNGVIKCPVCQQKINRREVKSSNDVSKSYVTLELMDQLDRMVEPPPAKKKKLAEPVVHYGTRCAECSDEAVLSCTTCRLNFCEECSLTAHPDTMTMYADHKIYPINEVPFEVPKCARHRNQDAEFICIDDVCQNRKINQICHLCLDNQHAGHRYEPLSDRIEREKKRAQDLLPSISDHLKKINELAGERKERLEFHDKNGPASKSREQIIIEFYDNLKAKTLQGLHEFLEGESVKISNDMEKLERDKHRFEAIEGELKSVTSTSNSNLALVQDAQGMAMDALQQGLECNDYFRTRYFQIPDGQRI